MTSGMFFTCIKNLVLLPYASTLEICVFIQDLNLMKYCKTTIFATHVYVSSFVGWLGLIMVTYSV